MNNNIKLFLLKNLHKLSKKTVQSSKKTEAGFNLLEVVTVVIILGILSAIIAPAWDAFVNRQRLRAAQNTVFQAMQSAHAAARGTRSSWQVTFKTDTDDNGNERVYVALLSANFLPNNDIPTFNELPTVGEQSGVTENAWYPLAEKIKISNDNNYTNSLVRVTDENEPGDVESYSEGNTYRILFNYNGCPIYADGDECTQSDALSINENNPVILTLTHENMGDARRCVRVETIIGSMRTAEGEGDQGCQPDDS